MKNTFKLVALKNWLLNKERLALPILLLLLFFLVSITTSQLPVTLAQEDHSGGDDSHAFTEVHETQNPADGSTSAVHIPGPNLKEDEKLLERGETLNLTPITTKHYHIFMRHT